MSRESRRHRFSTQHAASLHISLIFYTVSLTKAANISKQKYYHAAYPIFFGITPSLLFRRVSRLSYAGSHSGRTWDSGRGLSGISADILHKNLLIWSLGLSLWWSHGMNKFTASIPDAEANEWHICFSQRLCQISISPMICCANAPYRSSNSRAYTYRGTKSCRKGILCCETSGPTPSFNSTPLPSLNLSRTSRACGTCSNSKATWRWWLPWWWVASLLQGAEFNSVC